MSRKPRDEEEPRVVPDEPEEETKAPTSDPSVVPESAPVGEGGDPREGVPEDPPVETPEDGIDKTYWPKKE